MTVRWPTPQMPSSGLNLRTRHQQCPQWRVGVFPAIAKRHSACRRLAIDCLPPAQPGSAGMRWLLTTAWNLAPRPRRALPQYDRPKKRPRAMTCGASRARCSLQCGMGAAPKQAWLAQRRAGSQTGCRSHERLHPQLGSACCQADAAQVLAWAGGPRLSVARPPCGKSRQVWPLPLLWRVHS